MSKAAIIAARVRLLYCGEICRDDHTMPPRYHEIPKPHHEVCKSHRKIRNPSHAMLKLYRMLCYCIASVLVLSASIGAARADALLDEPLALSEHAPLTQRFNLPAMSSGELLPQGAAQWRLGVDVANNFVRDRSGAENLVLDGESQRYELGVRYGLGSQWEIGAMVPWISFNGGVLDNFIEGWHSVWGLPDGGRPHYRARQLQFLYQRNNRTELNIDSAKAGFGDVQLRIANQLLQTAQDNIALIASINLPTGDDAHLTGSGGTNASVSMAATHSAWLDLPLTLSGNIGVQTLPQSGVLSDRQKKSVWFGGAEIAWAAASEWRLRAQINLHSAIYDSALTSLGATSTQLLLGGSVRLSPRWVLDAAVGEDIAVDTAPDVTLQLALKTRY